MVIYFTKYDHKKSIKMLGLHYHKLRERIEEPEGKIYQMDDYVLDKVLDKIKELIGNKKFFKIEHL